MYQSNNILIPSNTCVIMPTYNNEKTLARVLHGILDEIGDGTLIVVNDGGTDSTSNILEDFSGKIDLISYKKNQGKGFALRKGLKRAIDLGFDHALTIDSDGQHFPEDISVLLKAVEEHPGTVVMGSRNMNQEGIPNKSSFGNRFSNFWFWIETFIKLPDTQTGFRIYPLSPLKKMRLFTKKFEFEIEIIVRLAWRNVMFKSVPIKVLYDSEERVSHFRPGRDFFRISVLNTILVICAFFYYYPKKFFSRKTLNVIKYEAIKPDESNLSKALSLAFGVFMGIAPIWGFQLLVGVPLAILFRMNKVLFITAANISIPPMIPVIIYTSFIAGQIVIEGSIDHTQMWSMSTESIQDNFMQYIVGAIILAVAMFVVVFAVSYLFLSSFRKSPKTIDI